MSLEEDQKRDGLIEGKELEIDPVLAPLTEESPDFELGDSIYVMGGKLDGTRGRIYYLDPDLLRILPDGVSDRLIDIGIVDGDLDPKLAIDKLYLVAKRSAPAFVTQINAQVGQSADTFSETGDMGIQYTIQSIDEANDSLVLEDATEGQLRVEFDFRGIPQDIPFAVLRPRSLPSAANLPVDGAIEEAQEEPDAEGFEFLEELEEEIVGIQETPSTQLFYPDIVQRNDMFREMLEAIPLASQKNVKQQRDLRRLVEQCILLRNEAVSYSGTGEPNGKLSTSFQTILDLLKSPPALSRPIMDVKRTLYMDHSKDGNDPREVPGTVEIKYIHDVIEESMDFMEREIGAPGAPDAMAPWFVGWERYFKEYMRTWLDSGEGDSVVFKEDKEFLRASFSGNLEKETDGLIVLGPTRDGRDIILQVPPSGLGKVGPSLMKGLGPRSTRLKERDARRIETADEGVIDGQLLFPLSTERDLGLIRSGRLSKDIIFSQKPPRTIYQILQDLSGVPAQATTGGIVSVGTNGNTSGNISLEDWIKSQPLYPTGMADALIDLKSLGLAQKEFTADQQEVIIEKINQVRALVKQYIIEEHELSVKKITDLRLENRTFLEGEALEQYIAVLTEEPLLAARVAEIRARIPAYKDNDIALTAGLLDTVAQLFLTAFAGVPGPLAKERHRRVRDQFLEALRVGLARSIKKSTAGIEPQPNRCAHVGSLNAIRKVSDSAEKILLLARLIARFSSGRKDNWLNCSVCNQHLLCYHEELQMQEFIRPREKETLHKELLLTFSNGVFQGKYMCGNCGQSINDMDFDQGLEYDDSGKPMSGRAVLIDKDAEAEEDIDMILGGPAEAPEALKFTTDVQTLVYTTARQILDRVGIYADIDSYKRIVERVESEIQKQPSREQYAKRVSEKKAQGTKSIDYDVLINRILVSATGAHALLEAQTHVPGYVLRTKLQGCKAGLSGYPVGSEKDRTGLEYFSCAIAGIKINETPWNLTGFLRESSDKKRQDIIAKSIESILTEALKTALVQQRITEKRAYLEKLYGSAEFADRLPEAVPAGFYPIPYAISETDATEAIIVPNAATPAEAVRGWIQTSHRLARQFGTYIRGSPYSETSCCFTPITEPGFWNTQDMPSLPLKTPPRGKSTSEVTLPFKPRPAARLFPELPEALYYRVFLRVCYDGPRKGLPHEPGYTKICSHCGFEFPESPYSETAAVPQSKELIKDWQADMDAILENGKMALATQNVVINRTTFDDVLDSSHKAFSVPRITLPKIQTGAELLVRLSTLELFEEWKPLMAATLERVARLSATPDEIEVADAYGPLSNAAAEELVEIERRIGGKSTTALRNILQQSPGQIAESFRTYLLIPFQRTLSSFRVKSLRVQRSYDLATGTRDDLHELLETHLDYLGDLSKRSKGLTEAKLKQARDRLSIVIPILKNDLRASFVPGGRFGLPYIVGAMLSGIISEFINPNRVPDGPEIGQIDLGAKATIQILDVCLNRLQVEGLKFSDQQVRDMISRRAEAEKVSMINKLAKMTPEEKKVELMKKRLGLGDWAIGGTKAIYAYDPEQYERERAQRDEMGLGMEVVGEGGYENDQMAADDY
jgi:hypothetical protein